MASQEDDDDARRKPFQYPAKFPVIDGVIYLPGTTRQYLQDITNLPVKGDEVFVATYPRSGTTWISEIVWQIFLNGRIDKKPIRVRVPFLENVHSILDIATTKQLVDFFSDKPSPRVFKIHLQYCLTPMGDGVTRAKYINVIRNPKDCAVSFYHKVKSFSSNDFDGPWEEFLEMFMEGRVAFGSWFDHVLGWWEHRDDPSILNLKYEDMKKDLTSAVKQIAKFVGKELSEETIQLIAKQTSFEAMSKGDGTFYDGDEDFQRLKKKQNAIKFLRKGEVGDWRNYFTEEQSRRFDELYERKIAGSGLELEYF